MQVNIMAFSAKKCGSDHTEKSTNVVNNLRQQPVPVAQSYNNCTFAAGLEEPSFVPAKEKLDWETSRAVD